ncbi:hypothetical protein CBL_04164 [Carabus blaptoides fortunei]
MCGLSALSPVLWVNRSTGTASGQVYSRSDGEGDTAADSSSDLYGRPKRESVHSVCTGWVHGICEVEVVQSHLFICAFCNVFVVNRMKYKAAEPCGEELMDAWLVLHPSHVWREIYCDYGTKKFVFVINTDVQAAATNSQGSSSSFTGVPLFMPAATAAIQEPPHAPSCELANWLV